MFGAVFLATGLAVLIALLFGVMAIYAEFRGSYQEKRGQAALREAEWDRQITIEEARAQNESATLQAEARIKQETANAQAEVIRAQGVADANAIIGEGLKDNEAYLRYLWIEKISNANTFYIPTEANLPILEAGKR